MNLLGKFACEVSSTLLKDSDTAYFCIENKTGYSSCLLAFLLKIEGISFVDYRYVMSKIRVSEILLIKIKKHNNSNINFIFRYKDTGEYRGVRFLDVKLLVSIIQKFYKDNIEEEIQCIE